MSISNETKQKINKFAEEQSQNYLENTEMTYMEKLRKKASGTKNKVGAKMAKLKSHSEKGLEVRDDMILYMSDYINDLISQGMSEKEAFDKASAEMEAAGKTESGENGDLHDRIKEYYSAKAPEDYANEGMFYGGLPTIGIVIGGLIGYITGGGRTEFLNGGWIDMLVGILSGAVLGAGLAMVVIGIINAVKKR
ncbi:MAG: hypothetical protein FWD71_08205 [Oscillospiraceae bacterium]|nr:hypothetical protein [Oscillospiraceae bacterium]